MRLKQLSAQPHPDGNRIDLQWAIAQAEFEINPHWRVQVVRSTITFPFDRKAGDMLTDGADLSDTFTLNDAGDRVYTLSDTGLRGETVYYYTLFPYTAGQTDFPVDRQNQIAAMATAPYGLAEQMYDLLPGIYQRYDTTRPRMDQVAQPGQRALAGQVAYTDREKGQLRRFLEIVGGQLDLFYSATRSLRQLADVESVDGRLLSLLADWIGWETDRRQPFNRQRNEIRAAPHLYQTIGIIPTVEATIKRIMGWECRIKEFVHNVFLTNQPERLNLWLMRHSATKGWETSTQPFSLDAAYNGRPAAATTSDGTHWLFYHTLHNDAWQIWYKTQPTGRDWTPSQPLRQGSQAHRHPTAVTWGNQLWVFWDVYDQVTDRWHIEYQVQDKDQPGFWKEITPFMLPSSDGTLDDTQCRQPVAVVDTVANQLWLFWLQPVSSSTNWQLRYMRFDLPVSEATLKPAMRSSSPVDPPSAGKDDLFAMLRPANGTQQLWLFWAQQVAIPSIAQTRWRIFYRVKQSLDPQVSNDWGKIFELPPTSEPATDDQEPAELDHDDREPAVLIHSDGTVELFWSSTRTGSWSIWHALLSDVTAPHDWQSIEQATENAYSQRNPLPVLAGTETLLFYRSNERLAYQSSTYTATSTVDGRYAGSTTIDMRNRTKNTLRGRFEDFQTYSYDTGPHGDATDETWYARDTVGIYLTPTVSDPQQVQRGRRLIEQALPSFMPIQARAVFFIQHVDHDWVYTYDYDDKDDSKEKVSPRLIGEQFFDSTIPESYRGLDDSYTDMAPGWVWLRSWSQNHPDHRTVDLDATPINLQWRTWHIGLKMGT